MQSEDVLRTWRVNLAEFGRRNHLRPTRIEVVDPSAGLESDFWIEDGMLLSGIDLEEDPRRGLSVDIMLQTTGESGRNHLTQRISGVKRLDVENDELKIEDAANRLTIMRFEH